jgi:hypothetical protein
VRHAGAWFTSPPGAATLSEEIFGISAETEETSWPRTGISRGRQHASRDQDAPNWWICAPRPPPSPEHSKAYRLGDRAAWLPNFNVTFRD